MNLVRLEFVDKNGRIASYVNCPVNTKSVEFVFVEGQVEIWIDYKVYIRCSMKLWEKMRHIRGFKFLRNLKSLYIDGDTCTMAPFFEWPEVSEILKRVSYISLPSSCVPAYLKIFANFATIHYSDRSDKFIAGLKLHYPLSKPFLNRKIVNLAIAFCNTELPLYIIVWICDWIPNMRFLVEYEKVFIIENVFKSIKHFGKK